MLAANAEEELIHAVMKIIFTYLFMDDAIAIMDQSGLSHPTNALKGQPIVLKQGEAFVGAVKKIINYLRIYSLFKFF